MQGRSPNGHTSAAFGRRCTMIAVVKILIMMIVPIERQIC